MGDNRYAFITGIFMLACIATVMAFVIAIKGAGSLFEEKRHYVVYFPTGSDLAGLKQGSAVQIFGVKVGMVESVELDLKEESKTPGIRVSITVPEKYVLREGAQAKASKSLTGDAWILISDTGSGAPLTGGETIEGTTASIQAIMTQISAVVPKVTKMVEKFTETAETFTETGKKAQVLIEDVDGKIDGVIERYDKLTDTATEALAEIRDIFGDTGGDIRTTMANISEATTSLKDRLPDILDKAKDTMSKASELMGSAQEAMKNVEPILKDGKNITGDIRSLLAENRVKVNSTMTYLQQASASLKGGIEDIRAAPWRLLNKPNEKDQANLAVYAIARSYASAAESLEIAVQTLKAAQDDPRINEEQLKELQENLQVQFENFEIMQQELWSRFQP